jgi:outer membrane protein assembly factor BamA
MHDGSPARGGGAEVRALLGAVGALLAAGCSIKQPPQGALTVERVDIVGAERVDDDDVEDAIATTETHHILGGVLEGIPILGVFDALTVEYHRFDRLVLERDLERVRRFYQARGHYEAEVRAGRVVRSSKGMVRVEIEVNEGEPVRLGTVDLDFVEWREHPDVYAKLVEERLRYAGEGGVRPVFDEAEYDSAKKRLLRALTDNGFAYAAVKGEVTIDLPDRRADVKLTVQSGPTTTFGPVTIEGLGPIPEDQVQSAIDIAENEPYSTAKLEVAQYHLADLGVFGSIEIVPEKSPPEEMPRRVIPVRVRLSPIKLRGMKAGIGGELGARVEVHGVAGWEDRNLFGGLRKFSVQTKPGLVIFPTTVNTLFSEPPSRVLPEVDLRIDFEQPAFLEAHTRLLAAAGARIYVPQNIIAAFDEMALRDTKEERRALEAAAREAGTEDTFPTPVVIGYREVAGSLGLDRKWRFSELGGFTIYGAQFFKIQFADPFAYNDEPLPDGYRRVYIPYLESVLAWDIRQDADGRPETVAPNRGVYLGVNVQVGTEFLAGDAGDVRLRPDFRAYAPLTRDVVFAFRWTTGFLFPRSYGQTFDPSILTAASTTPEIERDLQLLSFRGFFSGGPNSNRGYGFRGVGPHGPLAYLNPGGQGDPPLGPTGGVGMWELSGELRVPIYDDLVGVIFLDASDVVLAFDQFRFTHPHLSPGLGLRYVSPVGRIRLDLGFRPPYLQRIGESRLEPHEGGPGPDEGLDVPIAFALAIGEAF